MRNPWVQIAQEVFEVSTPELAIELDVSEPEALSALVKLVPWALARCPDDEPPSENDLVEGPTAARKIARGVGWTGDPETFCRVVAALRYPMLEILPEGIRVRGLDRYDASWGDRNRALWDLWKLFRAGEGPRPGSRRTSAEIPTEKRGTDPDPDPDPDLNHHHQTSSSEPPPPVVVDVGKCWTVFGEVRVAAGLKPEGSRPPKGFASWCEARGREGFTVRDLGAGYGEFLTDSDFRAKNWPAAVFVKNCWKTRVRHLGPEPAPPSPLQLEFEARLLPLRARGHGFAAHDLLRLVPVGIAGELVQLRAADKGQRDWAADHYGDWLKELRLELLPLEAPS